MTLRNRGAPSGFESVAAPVMFAAMKRANWRSWFFRMKSATAAMSLDPRPCRVPKLSRGI